MGGWGPERLSHPVWAQTCSLQLGFEPVQERLTTNHPCGALFHLVRAQGGEGYLSSEAALTSVTSLLGKPGCPEPAGLTPESRRAD